MKHINPEPPRRDCDGILKPARKGVVIRLMRSLLKTKGAILDELNQLKQKVDTLMTTLDEDLSAIKADQAVTDAKLDAVAADITALLAKIGSVPLLGLTPEQAAAIADIGVHTKAINDRLAGIDASANPPAAPAADPAPTA